MDEQLPVVPIDGEGSDDVLLQVPEDGQHAAEQEQEQPVDSETLPEGEDLGVSGAKLMASPSLQAASSYDWVALGNDMAVVKENLGRINRSLNYEDSNLWEPGTIGGTTSVAKYGSLILEEMKGLGDGGQETQGGTVQLDTTQYEYLQNSFMYSNTFLVFNLLITCVLVGLLVFRNFFGTTRVTGG